MNASSHDRFPLPLPEDDASARDRQIAGIVLDQEAVNAFNHELHCLRTQAPSVCVGQLAVLVQWLQSLPRETAVATIDERMARAELLRGMLHDGDWDVPEDLAQRAQRLLNYINRFDDLIPDDLELIGHLDDALMVELSWDEFAGEIQDYLDFCRFIAEHHQHGNAIERRAAWESACLQEANALLKRQHIRERGYARPEPLDQPLRVC